VDDVPAGIAPASSGLPSLGVTPRPETRENWLLAPRSMVPISERQCLVRSRVTPALAVLTSEIYGLLAYCEGCKPIAEHADAIVAAIPGLAGQRAAVLHALEAMCASGLFLRDDALLDRLAGPSEAEPAPLWGVVIRTCDRPDLLQRLVRSLADNERNYGNRYRYHVLDDSRDEAHRLRNRQFASTQTALSLDYHDLAGDLPLRAALDAAFPHLRTEITWLLGSNPDASVATYGRPLNFALLLAAGERFVTVDDDVVLDARSAPRFKDGLEVSADRDDWDFFSSDAQIDSASEPAGIDPIAAHAQWLGRNVASIVATQLPMPNDWARGLASDDLLRVTADSTILFTQNGVYGDPGSSLYPLHLFELDGEANARFTRDAEQYARNLRTRHNWRGRSRLRIAPHRLLTLTTLSGFDNRALLPPTIPSLRNEDLLIGRVAQLAHPHAVMLDFPWALLHFRVPPKQWNALDDALPFRQDPPHFILDEVDSAATRCVAESSHARLRMLAATLRDLADASDALLRERLEHQLLDTRARHRFALERQLGSKRDAPSYWRKDVEALLKHRSLSMTTEDVADALASVKAVRMMLANYARALDAWVDIWNYCRQTPTERRL
jgi:hypothetical protein